MFKFLCFALTLSSTLLYAKEKPHVSLAAAVTKIGKAHFVVLDYTNDKKWHTYWKNPGDAGLPIENEFTVAGTKQNFSEEEWPTPKKYIEQGDILAYGYEGNYQFFYELTPEQVLSLKNKTLDLYSKWLVCKDICIPGSKRLSIKLNSESLGKTDDFQLTAEQINKSFEQIPHPVPIPKDLEITLVKANEENRLALHYTLSNIELSDFDANSNLLTPYPTTPFDFKREDLYYDSDNKTLYGRLYVDWDGEYQEPIMPFPVDGKFENPIEVKFLIPNRKQSHSDVMTVRFDGFSLMGDESYTRVLKNFSPIKHSGGASLGKKESTSDRSIFLFLFFGFIGGLILNLMPCVLPVISLKLFGLIVHSDEEKSKILKHNLAYTIGVVVSFWVLAVAILILKTSGEQIGWGFQLQSPGFVFIMLVLLLVMAMNMLGLFEFMTPGGKILGNVEIKKGFSGDFISGVLATILSTPCSAPFLGTALTFAFTTGQFNIFLIFTAIGLGLASPFVVTGFFPKLVSFLPKPGAWMEKLKNILGYSLLLTFVWLYDVLASLIDMSLGGMSINMFFASLFFAFYFRKKISKVVLWNVVLFVIPAILATSILNMGLLKTSSKKSQTIDISGMNWKPWSTSKMQELATQKKWVFIDFTASWCLTCKVNKKLVLNTENFAKVAKKYDLELLVGDWSQRDEMITQFLLSYDVVGVPAYFMQNPKGEIIYLGETISITEIEEVIEKSL